MNALRNLLIAGVTLLVIIGCGSDTDTSAPPPAGADEPREQATATATQPAKPDPTAGMASAVGTGKPGAPVNLKYDLLSRPVVGQPVEVELAIVPTAPIALLKTSVTGMEGLSLGGTESITDVENPSFDEPTRFRFTVTPNENGMFYVTVMLSVTSTGAEQFRSFSIPLVVGTTATAEKPAAAPEVDASGQPIQSMPAEESGSR